MEWVEIPDKGRNTLVLLREFEERFARLSVLDRTLLDTSRVLLFVKSVDERDREQVGLLLETDDGLTADWAVVKRVCCLSALLLLLYPLVQDPRGPALSPRTRVATRHIW